LTPDIFINGARGTIHTLAPWIESLSNSARLRSWGGVIWKFLWDEKLKPSAEWALSPALWEGERQNHFDLKFMGEDPRCLIGSVSARGEWMILVKLARELWTETNKFFVRNEWLALAQIIKAAGYTSKAPLDYPTRMLLSETQLFVPVPEDLLHVAQ